MSNMTHMSETMVQYLRMMVMYNTLAAQGNKEALQQLTEMAKAETVMSFETLDKVLVKINTAIKRQDDIRIIIPVARTHDHAGEIHGRGAYGQG